MISMNDKMTKTIKTNDDYNEYDRLEKAENINRRAAVGAERETKIGCKFRASSSYREFKDLDAQIGRKLISSQWHRGLSIPVIVARIIKIITPKIGD